MLGMAGLDSLPRMSCMAQTLRRQVRMGHWLTSSSVCRRLAILKFLSERKASGNPTVQDSFLVWKPCACQRAWPKSPNHGGGVAGPKTWAFAGCLFGGKSIRQSRGSFQQRSWLQRDPSFEEFGTWKTTCFHSMTWITALPARASAHLMFSDSSCRETKLSLFAPVQKSASDGHYGHEVAPSLEWSIRMSKMSFVTCCDCTVDRFFIPFAPVGFAEVGNM